MRRLSWHLGFGSDDPEYNEWERQAFRTVVRGCLVGAVFALVFTILAAVWDGHLGWHAVGLGAASGIAIAVTEGRLSHPLAPRRHRPTVGHSGHRAHPGTLLNTYA